MINILKANKKRFESTFRLFAAHIQESTGRNVSVKTSEKLISFIRTYFKMPNTFFYLAVDGRKSVGYIVGAIKMATHWTNDFDFNNAELIELYVMPEYREKGVGSNLLHKFMSWCSKKEIKRIYLETEVQDRKAVIFWKKRGFARAWIGMEKRIV